jgi:hypothetical protein
VRERIKETGGREKVIMEETEEREGNPNLEKPNRNVSVEGGRSVSVCVPGVSISEDRLGPKQR